MKQVLFISWELSKSLIETVKAMKGNKGFDLARFTTTLCGEYSIERQDDGLIITREMKENENFVSEHTETYDTGSGSGQPPDGHPNGSDHDSGSGQPQDGGGGQETGEELPPVFS